MKLDIQYNIFTSTGKIGDVPVCELALDVNTQGPYS